MAEKNPSSESHPVPVGPLAPGQRWSLARKREALRLLRGEPIEALSRELGVEVYRLERWKDKALAGLDAGPKEREGDPVQAQLDAALRWEDVDLEAARLAVRRALIPHGDTAIGPEPKTARGRRVIALDAETVESLKTQAARQMATWPIPSREHNSKTSRSGPRQSRLYCGYEETNFSLPATARPAWICSAVHSLKPM